MGRDWEKEKKQFNEKIGNNLKEAIKKAGYSQKDFSKILGVNESTIVRWVTNKVTPDLFYLYKSSQILNIRLEDMLEGYIFMGDATLHDGIFTPREIAKLKEIANKVE